MSVSGQRGVFGASEYSNHNYDSIRVENSFTGRVNTNFLRRHQFHGVGQLGINFPNVTANSEFLGRTIRLLKMSSTCTLF
jgi:hypothetical protein